MSGRFMRDGTYDPDPAWSFEPEQQEQDLATIRKVADSLPREEPDGGDLVTASVRSPHEVLASEQPEDAHLESAYEDRYPEPYEPSVYDGTDNSDPGFYSDYGDE